LKHLLKAYTTNKERMIEIQNLTKTFKLSKKQRKEMGPDFKGSTVDAVRNLSLTTEPGRVFSLLGANGAGKTTTLRMVSTMLKPSAGSIRVCGLDVQTQAAAVRRKIGFLTGSTGLYARLTPNEMVSYFAALNGLDRQTVESRKQRYYDLLDMNGFANRQIGKLSTGMKQKVSIVRTMIHNPEVVVFDEPTSGLDVITARHIIELIRDCKNDGKTVIFSTHIMSEVDMLSDDLAIIHRGQLVYSGTYPEFKSSMQADSLEDEFVRLAETVSA
jgi:sodium transport system ATP-binding protein